MSYLPDDLAAELGDLISRARTHSDPYALSHASPTPTPPTVINWNVGQQTAIDRIVRWRIDPSAPTVLALTGAAGTGKTTVLQEIRKRLAGTRTAWAAMTGKAASRMREASGVNAKTLHSVLYYPPREVDNEVDQKVDLEFEQVKSDGRSCLLVIDESSMIGSRLFNDIKGSSYDKILLVGDPYQIPPVLSKQEEAARGGDYTVFSDRQRLGGLIEAVHLDEVMRNAGAVLRAATHVRERQEIPTESESDDSGTYSYTVAGYQDMAMQLAIQAWLDDREDHVLITWRNDNRMLANRVIRTKLGHTAALPDVGEPMVIRRNVYGTDLMNGDVVHVAEWLDEGPTLCGVETRNVAVRAADQRVVYLLVPTQKFDGTLPYVGLSEWRSAIRNADVEEPVPLTFAYCLTAHLAQGSQWRRVTTFLPGDLDHQHFKKMTKLPSGETMPFSMRFLYTALARAKSHTSLVVTR